jgi:hypothetical protein
MLNKFLLTLLTSSGQSNKKILFLIFCVITALVVDTSFIKISDLISEDLISNWMLPLFVIISITYMIGQYLILGFVEQKIKKNSSLGVLRLGTIHNWVRGIQFVLVTVNALVILQIILSSTYNSLLLTVATSISSILAISLMALLARRFFSWFKSNRNLVVLLYGFSTAMLAINAGFSVIFVDNLLADKPAMIQSHREFSFRVNPNSLMGSLNLAYIGSSIVSFMMIWGATAILLQHYSKRFGQVKYWIILSIPLTYFLSQFVILFLRPLDFLFRADPVSFSIFLTLAFTLSKPIGGILFGIGLWTVTKNINPSNIVRNYMIISAYGFVILFTSNQSIVISSAFYPPFGLASVSFMGLASYLILVGIYYSAISFAHDVTLRQSIKKSAIKESKLLDSIGTAHMEQEIQERVIAFTKQNQERIAEESGIQSSLTEEDMRQYLQQVIEEVKKGKINSSEYDANHP